MKIASSDYELVLFFKEIEKIISCDEIMKNIMLSGRTIFDDN